MAQQGPTPYFIDPSDAPKLVQMPGLETIVLTGLGGEKMMMVLNIYAPDEFVSSLGFADEGAFDRVRQVGDLRLLKNKSDNSGLCRQFGVINTEHNESQGGSSHDQGALQEAADWFILP